MWDLKVFCGQPEYEDTQKTVKSRYLLSTQDQIEAMREPEAKQQRDIKLKTKQKIGRENRNLTLKLLSFQQNDGRFAWVKWVFSPSTQILMNLFLILCGFTQQSCSLM